VLGLALSSVAGGLLGVAHNVAVLIVLLLLIGVGAAFFHPQALAAIRGMISGRPGLLTATFLVGGELGRGLWPTVASVVTANLGLLSLWIIAVPGALTVPLLRRWMPQLPARASRGRAIRMHEHAYPMSVLIGYRCIRAFTIIGLSTFIPIMWHLRGGTLVTGASIITTMTVVGVVGNLGGGHLADIVGRRPVLIVGSLASAALIFPVIYLRGAPVWIAAAALGIALFATNSTTILIGQDIFPENRAMGSGIALGLANGVGALLVLIVGLWVSGTSVMIVFWVMAALSLLAAAVALAFPHRLMR
jgi:FSR family fosmidomycin resistance protein-like MFS transporter